MSRDSIEALLLEADESAPRFDSRPPRLEDLEGRRRAKLLRRGASVALIAVLFLSALSFSAARRHHRNLEWQAATADLSRAFDDLETALSSLTVDRTPAPSEVSEEVALTTFRALHRSADRGDETSIEGLRWLAESFASTQGGRCARLFLKDHGVRTESSSAMQSERFQTK